MTVAAAHLKLALELTHEWHNAQSAEELLASALPGLHRLVPADAIGWNEIDLAGGSARYVVDPADYLPPAGLETLTQHVAEHPVVSYYASTGDGRPVAISDFLSTRAFRRTELYDTVYRSLGTEDQLAFAVEAGSVVMGVAFSRGARSFRADERFLLDLLRPHLASAHANLQAFETAQRRLETLERGLEEGGRGLAFVLGDRVEPASRSGAELLGRWFPDGPPPLPAPGERLVVDTSDARLTLRLADGGTLLLLDEISFAPDPKRAQALGLNPREAEVLLLAARGLSNAQIAKELFISARTVGKHLEHAYVKLGVHSRADAVARLFER